MGLFKKIEPTAAETAMQLPGDDIITEPSAVLDRAFSLPGAPEVVWPWFAQLGKHRAGWYLPRAIERFVPVKRRGLRVIDPAQQQLQVGQRIDDWGGYLEVVEFRPPTTLLYKSTHGKISISWAITLWPIADSAADSDGQNTRVIIRLRLASGGRGRFIKFGAFFDALTIAGLAAGLQQRLRP